MSTLVLWDIDHTLIEISGLTAEIYAKVFRDVTGHRMEHLAPLAGRTDRAIITETLNMHGLPPSEELIRGFAEALATAFAERNGDIKRRGRSLPGAMAALVRFTARSDVVQSVVTGNAHPIAVGKLTAFNMHQFIDFEVGAYGMDDMDRAQLVRLARQRASTKYSERFTASTAVLIGDTPHDVIAGHQGGARVLAVATGSTDEKGLRAAGAEVVLPDLSDTDAVVLAALGR